MKLYFCAILAFIALLLTPCWSNAFGKNDVVFYNTGELLINELGILYIPNSMEATGETDILLNGNLYLGGSFYQNTESHVFDYNKSINRGNSIGYFHFVDATNSLTEKRFITTELTSYNRLFQAIVFPKLVINTSDTIKISPKLAIDATSISRQASTGALYLESTFTDGFIYDASLRITAYGKSEELVSSGSIIVAKDITQFRCATNDALKIFPFASPFKGTQIAGYFAGNWLRKPTAAKNNYLHTTYVLANRPLRQGVDIIHYDQYLKYAYDRLMPGVPHFIKLRELGYDYQQLEAENGLCITGANPKDCDLNKLIFNGRVFNMPPYEEQLFAEDTLFSYTFSENTITSQTINWVIGNSYTSAISIEKLANAMLLSQIPFSDIIYIYSPGSNSYTPINIYPNNSIQIDAAKEIPAMSIFMLRVSKNKMISAGASFCISKDMLTHSEAYQGPTDSFSRRANTQSINNQIVFKMTPQDNPYIYDMVAIGLRSDASLGSDNYDMSKVINNTDLGFQLYMLTRTNNKLSVNGVPETTSYVDLYLQPDKNEGHYQIEASDFENLSTDGLWLEDLLTSSFVNLKMEPSYQFYSTLNDPHHRFKVHFVNPLKTDVSVISNQTKTQVYYSSGLLHINNLTPKQLNTKVILYDVMGRMVHNGISIQTCPHFQTAISLPSGVYLAHIQGADNTVTKFIIP